MHCLPVLVFICHLLYITQAQIDVPGVRLNRSSLLRTFTPGNCSDGTGKTSICSSCSSQSLCFGGNAIAEVACPGSNPYCNPGNVEASCSNLPAVGCGATGGAQVSSIVCPALGVLPDPANCKVYHVCRNLQQNSDVYQCPPGYHFNLTTKWCRSDQVDQCVRVTCGTTSGFVYYGNSRQYFALCVVANGVTTSYIMKCPDRATFSMTSNSCVYQCAGQGNFENSNDPTSFYQCYVVNGSYVVALQRCPANTTFKESLQYCS
ncbi:AAEL012644-PA [Aedes aegypti]|uniref:AAEL012644-PA n=1 Tax=Aedes aegypti TaxID=7159 RepID=Q16LI0_AEDAE|nr:AAEL012644-PA [Aedes aegypti]